MDYSQMICRACGEGDSWPISKVKSEMDLIPGWTLDEEKPLISREFKFVDFKSAFSFADKIKDLAEKEGHHPELVISWGRLIVRLWTHSSAGISDNDFILASKINSL